jgi:hypothetical protein
METAYIQIYVNGYWQQISSCQLKTAQQDLEWWKSQHSDPVRAVDSQNRVVAV